MPDEVQGDLAATQALLNGHQRIGFINGPAEYTPAHNGRLAGYRRALELADVGFDAELVRTGDWWQESGARQAAVLLTLRRPVTAIFCGNDWMAIGDLRRHP